MIILPVYKLPKNGWTIVPVIFLLLIYHPIIFGQVPDELEDPWTIGIDKLPARTSIWPAPDPDAAREANYDHSAWIQSLNGDWKFHWSPDPESRPRGFHKPGFETGKWDIIPVPSTMERQGYGVPLYVNITYPFKVDPPRVMGVPDPAYTSFKHRNPVGSYKREFNIPDQWKDKQIILHFAGISSAAFVCVNGQKAGYTQGSRLPAEFDITGLVTDGVNELAVEVYKYCDGSYLEDQDFWRLSGIYRDVFIRAVPRVGLWDLYAQPVFDPMSQEGSMQIHYTPVNFTEEIIESAAIDVSLVSPGEDIILSGQLYELDLIIKGFNEEKYLPEIRIEKIIPWFPELPRQYEVLVSFLINDKQVESYQLPLAFRKIEAEGKRLLLNGQPFKIRGVNRHEFSADQGYTISREQMVEEIELLKQAHVNFVRTAHYPNDPRWYELCNEYGLMVMDEVNVESHGLSYHKNVLPGDHPEWSYACVDRMQRMVIRDRQHPCVLMWSLGNEAGFGSTFIDMRTTAHAHDPEQRLIQYADMNLAADFDSQTYPSIKWLRQHLRGEATRKGERGQPTHEHQHGEYPSGRPFVMNEYCHAMGNSLGNISDYWEMIYQEDMLAGGFVWDWIDQALWKTPGIPSDGFVYGGDFGDWPNDGNFCVNGLIGSDLIPHPHYQELKKVYQPVYFKLVGKDPLRIEVRNFSPALNTDKYELSFQLLENGIPTEDKVLPGFNCTPGSSETLVLNDLVFSEDAEVLLQLRFKSQENTKWSEAGRVIAWEQFLINTPEPGNPVEADRGKARITLEKAPGEYALGGEDFRVVIDRSTGLISSYVSEGDELLSGKAVFNFWRAMTDNDEGWKVDRQMAVWKNEAANYDLKSLKIVEKSRGKIVLESNLMFKSTGSTAMVRHTCYPDGTLAIDVEVNIPEGNPAMPRIGMQFTLNPSLSGLEWYGRGPHENYIDRKTAAAVGRYHSTVVEWITPYVRPQENANRCDVRWIRFAGGDESELVFTSNSDNLLSVSAWPYTQETLSEATHDYELLKENAITVNMDCIQMGVGGDNSWGLPVNDRYLVTPGTYSWGFRINATAD